MTAYPSASCPPLRGCNRSSKKRRIEMSLQAHVQSVVFLGCNECSKKRRIEILNPLLPPLKFKRLQWMFQEKKDWNLTPLQRSLCPRNWLQWMFQEKKDWNSSISGITPARSSVAMNVPRKEGLKYRLGKPSLADALKLQWMFQEKKDWNYLYPRWIEILASCCNECSKKRRIEITLL